MEGGNEVRAEERVGYKRVVRGEGRRDCVEFSNYKKPTRIES